MTLKGEAIVCAVCGLRKKPLGRSAPMEMAGSLCDDDCRGYRQMPYADVLWPGEAETQIEWEKPASASGGGDTERS